MLLAPQDMPIHGMVRGADPSLLYTHVASDVVTAFSYLSIAIGLTLLVYRLRRDLPFSALFLLFGAFIVLCGATHFLAVASLWWSPGWISAGVSAVTAAVSLLTAVLLPRQLPQIQQLVRDAGAVRERDRERARAEALSEANDLLTSQASQLELANARLVESLAQREALEAQLRQSQKMEVMGRLASGVAHDFNNLLTVMHGNVEMARASLGRESPVDSMLDDVAKATESATHLTRRLLAFGRTEHGARTEVSLDTLIANDERFFQRVLPSAMQMTFSLHSELAVIRVNTTQLQQAVLNLIVNARDAMHAKGTICVETARVDVSMSAPETAPPIAHGRYATITVRDSGTGISDEVRPRLFEPFFTTKPSGQGTGLGLAMVYETAAQHGGGVHVSSMRDAGSAFTLYLPIAA